MKFVRTPCLICSFCVFFRLHQVVTFGAPKVTDAPGAERLCDLLPVLRVTHERDPVPLMPLAPWDAALAKRKGLAVITQDNPESRMLSDTAECRESEQRLVGFVEKLDGEAVGGSSQAAGGRRESRFASSTVYSHFGSQVRHVDNRRLLVLGSDDRRRGRGIRPWRNVQYRNGCVFPPFSESGAFAVRTSRRNHVVVSLSHMCVKNTARTAPVCTI